MGGFRQVSCVLGVSFALLSACRAGDGAEVGVARGPLREAASATLTSAELDRVREANRRSTAAERLRARMEVANEVTGTRRAALRPVGVGSSPAAATNAIEDRFRYLREEIVERKTPATDAHEIAQEIAHAARRYAPTSADRELDQVARERLRPPEQASRVGARGR